MRHYKKSTRLYHTWSHMKERCYNPNCKDYFNYGMRGIQVCNEWLHDFMVFYNWAISNGYDDTLTIDRIDVDGNYEPSNCRWATIKEQARNRRNTIYVDYKGETRSLPDWCDTLKLPYNTIKRRYYLGWSTDRMFTQKIR